jgi:hypothetical protein
MVNPGHTVMLHVRADDAQGFIDREAAANPAFKVLHSELVAFAFACPVDQLFWHIPSTLQDDREFDTHSSQRK